MTYSIVARDPATGQYGKLLSITKTFAFRECYTRSTLFLI